MSKTKKNCPACKSKDFLIVEIWDGSTISWECEDGHFNKTDGALEPGFPVKLEATCKRCNHGWTIKGATQIDDIIT